MSDKLKNILIGIFTLMAIGITIAIILFLQPSIGDGKKTLKVRFSNVAGINIGTRVSFAGKPIGEVIKIEEVENARDLPTDGLGRIYYYRKVAQALHYAHRVYIERKPGRILERPYPPLAQYDIEVAFRQHIFRRHQ